MKSEDLWKAVGEIGEDLLARSEESGPEMKVVSPQSEKRRKKRVTTAWIAAAAACILVFGLGARAIRNIRMGSSQGEAVAEAARAESKEAAAEAIEANGEFDEAAPAEEAAMEEMPEMEMAEEAAPEETAPEERQEAEMADESAAQEMPTAEEAAAGDAGTEYDQTTGSAKYAEEEYAVSYEKAAVLVRASSNGENGTEAAAAEEAGEAIKSFQEISSAAILGSTDPDENKFYSPITLYAAMGMLSEITSGEARQEILNVLGSGDIDAVRNASENLLREADYARESGQSSLANSLWLRKGTPYKLTPLLHLGERYETSVFSGEMGSAEYDALLQEWVRDETAGLLSEESENIGFDSTTLLALVSSLYYKAAWLESFDQENTEQMAFHAASGDREVPMMRAVLSVPYRTGEVFDAAALPLRDGKTAVFYLPKEGRTVGDIISDPAFAAAFDSKDAWNDEVMVEIALPRFDIREDLDLEDAFSSMGVQDVMTDETAFSEVLDGAYTLTKAQQSSRIIVDEEGVTGASFVMEEAAAEDTSEYEKVEIVFDRPFAFSVTDQEGRQWFAGIVNEP